MNHAAYISSMNSCIEAFLSIGYTIIIARITSGVRALTMGTFVLKLIGNILSSLIIRLSILQICNLSVMLLMQVSGKNLRKEFAMLGFLLTLQMFFTFAKGVL